MREDWWGAVCVRRDSTDDRPMTTFVRIFRRQLAAKALLWLGVAAACHSTARAQFYTGSEMSFGRKRVQYEKFFWSYYRFDGFDVYFNRKGRNLALYTANYLQNRLPEMEHAIGYQADEGLKFIVFNRLSDFKQSNIGYLDESSETSYNTGGVTRFIDNKVFLYFEGDYVAFERQIRRGMATILLTQAISGAKVGTQYKNSYLMDLPVWFTEGLASYFSEPWNEVYDERMAQAILRNDYRYLSDIYGEDATFAGHAFWYFVSQQYGMDAVPRCVRIVASERSMDKTFKIALNKSMKDLLKEFREFFMTREEGVAREGAAHDLVLEKTNKPETVYSRFVVNRVWVDSGASAGSTDGGGRAFADGGAASATARRGGEVAFTTNRLGRAEVYVQSLNPTKRQRVYRTGAAINDMPDRSYPVLAWHPNGHALGIITEEKSRVTLVVCDLEKKRRERLRRYYLDHFEKITSFCFSPDGRSIAVSASSNGQSDIYLHNLTAGTDRQITFDLYDDRDPVFVPNSSLLVFTSNRPDDTLRKGEKFEVAPSMKRGTNLFAYDLKTGGITLFKLTDEGERVLLSHPNAIDAQRLLFLSNARGKTDLSAGRFGRVMDRVDTAVHYRRTFEHVPLSNLPPGLSEVDADPKAESYVSLGMEKGRYVLSVEPLRPLRAALHPKLPGAVAGEPTAFKREILAKEARMARRKALADSMALVAARNRAGANAGAGAGGANASGTNAGASTGANAAETGAATGIAAGAKAEAEAPTPHRRSLSLRAATLSDRRDTTAFDRYLAYRKALGLGSAPSAGAADSLGHHLNAEASSAEAQSASSAAGADASSINETSSIIHQNSPENHIIPKSNENITNPLNITLNAALLNDTTLLDSIPERVPPKQHTYRPEFFINQATTQLGFSFLNTTYQAFTGGNSPLYLNSGTNGFTQISLSDLMENHRIVGGFTFSFDFTTFEYLLSYEYLERRLSHQFVLHLINRNNNTAPNPYKQNTYNGYYVMKYPLSQVSTLKGTVFARYDRTVFKSYEWNSLIEPHQRQLKVGLKGEWVYDDTRLVTQNIYNGTRGKVFGEYYQGIVHDNQNLFVVGFDFRHYSRLYKTFIWANRIAGSTSFGQQQLVYYMGGIDGWLLPRFNREIKTDQRQNYAYQTLATNMRGFIQNIRNGNSFMVINSELRLPVAQVISRGPVKSSFLRHLQVVGFADVGSAWSNLNPWSRDNPFYKQVIEDGKITITLEKEANPIVLGFGAGLRCRLLGYFLRLDAAWGVENGLLSRKPVVYFSLSTDF